MWLRLSREYRTKYKMIKIFLCTWRLEYKLSVFEHPHTIDELKMAITEYIRNVDCAILNTALRTQFSVSINVWRVAGDTLNITCIFPYCNYQVHRDFMITLYINIRRLEILVRLITANPDIMSHHLLPITLYEQKIYISSYLDLSPQIVVNKLCIFWAHFLWCATLLIKLTLPSGLINVVAGQSRMSSQSLDSYIRKYQGRLSANCMKKKYMTFFWWVERLNFNGW